MGDLQFRPGQFIVLELSIDNKPRRSAFSIVRKEGKGFILGVKLRGAGARKPDEGRCEQCAEAERPQEG